ncbi:MAG TPA: peptidoglycan-binding protein [Pyrinomonadaceae bacterium]|jgi:photosystem II stability/assembly factor-like uncharacterized protein
MRRYLFCLLALALCAPAAAWRTTRAAAPDHAGTTTDASARPVEWEITGPMGGDVRSLAIDPRDPNHLYFGTIDGQIYVSRDGATTWARVRSFNRPGLYIDNLLIDPRDANTIYAAAHRHKEPGGFFKSTDGGQTWREATELKTESVFALTQAPSNPDILVVGTHHGVFRSTDAGATWAQLPTSSYPDIRDVESVGIDPRNPDHIYAGTWHLPWKTEDGGQTWFSVKDGIIDDSDVFAIEIDQRNPDHVIMSACSGIYESRNAGRQFRKVQGIPSQSRRTRDILQNPAQPSAVYAGTTEGFWRTLNGGESWMLTTSRKLEINAIAVHPDAPQTVFIGTNNYGVMVSKDGGKTFLPSNQGYSGRRAYFLMPDRARAGRFYASTINTATGGGFFFVSDDGGETWQPSMRNMPDRLITYAMLQDRTDANVIYLGTNLGVYRSADRGASWAPIGAPAETAPKPKPARRRRGTTAARRAAAPAPAPPVPASSPTERALVQEAQAALNAAGYDVGTPDGVAGTRTIATLRKFQSDKQLPVTGTFDETTLGALGLAGGKQTLGVGQGIQTAPIALTETVNALAYYEDEGGASVLAATNNGLYRSADPAKGWTRLPFGPNFDARTLCLSTSPKTPQTIWVGTSKSGVLVTRDGGATWAQVAGITTVAPINVIAQDPQRPSHIYVGTTQQLLASFDGGEKWLRRGGNLPYGSYTAILINPHNPDEMFVGSAYEREDGNGVFHSADAGMTWKRIDPELPSRRVWALAFDQRDATRILVGSHSAGVFVASRNANATAAAK